MKSWKELRPQVVTDPDRVAAHRKQFEAEVTAYRLAEIREVRSLTQGQVARELGVNQSNVSRLETGGLAGSQVGTLAAYIGALGGTLRLVADFEDVGRHITLVVDGTEGDESHHAGVRSHASVKGRHLTVDRRV